MAAAARPCHADGGGRRRGGRGRARARRAGGAADPRRGARRAAGAAGAARGRADRRPRGRRVSWTALLLLAAAAWAMKAAGPLVLGGRTLRPDVEAALGLVPVALLGALILVQTVDGGERLVLDARVPALGVAALLVWRRAPFLVVVLVAAATAATLRAIA
ncbi:DNA-binding protein [Conexibacter sp. W3-3-2]|nr:DNA-binding protein [Conexibacter sp. W3-3-2]